MKRLINESTREERLAYIQQLFKCHNGDCDNCGVCQLFRGQAPLSVFQDYIDGKREFQDIMSEWNQRY